MIMQKAKITAKRQITVPIRVMRKLKLNPGDAITFQEKDDHIEILPAAKKFSAIDIIGQYPELSTKKIISKDIQKIREQSFSQRSEKFK